MKRLSKFIVPFLISISVSTSWAQTCPEFVHKANITKYLDSGYVLPVKGTVVTAMRYGNGLYKASLGAITPTLIPNTNTGTCNSVQITEDGQWVLYNQAGPTLIRIDGTNKTKVPAASYGSEGCTTFWWNAPSGKLEVVYRLSDNKTVHAVQVTLPATGAPTFANDRVIGQFASIMEFTMGIAGNHFFARFDDAHFGPKMVTLPASGAATESDFYVPSGNDYPSWGCMCTISHEGHICCFNAGYDQWCGCIADEFCLLRHKSFVLLPFQEKSAPAVAWQAVLLKTMAVSINFCPRKYLFLSPTDSTHGIGAATSNFWSDFKGWSYTNDSNYVVGDLECLPYTPDSMAGSHMPDSGTIWLAHYPTNTWTCILRPLTPVSRNTMLAYPAVWIDKSVGVIPRPAGSGLHGRGAASENLLFDIKGRMVQNNQARQRKLSAGIYYSMGSSGILKRIAIDR